MFYRVTRYEFQDGRQGDIAAWTDTKTDQVRDIDGLIAVDVFNSSPGEGVIVAAYADERAFEAASSTINEVLGELAQFLTAPPMTMSGSPFWTTRTHTPATR